MDITLLNVSYSYPGGKTEALKNINLTIKSGTMMAVVGESGSGKSTLLKLLNGLRVPTSGKVLVDGRDINEKNYDRKKLREKVGLVFQYPESQLFEKTVLLDVAFGPLSMGKSKEEALQNAKDALRAVNISRDKWDRSPFALSGGEKRKVAAAGILALKGEVIILDEISSGLDSRSRSEIFGLLTALNKEGKTIVFTSHDVEETASYSKEVILLEDGEIKAGGTIKDIYSYNPLYMTQGAELKVMFEKEGIKTGCMDSIEDSIKTLENIASGAGEN